MQDLLVLRVEEEQKELKSTLREISKRLHKIDVELTAIKSRVTVLSAGGAALFGLLLWSLQYLLTK